MAIELLVNGVLYGGWTSVSISRSIGTAAGAFNIECTENVGGEAIHWPIRPNDECEVRVAGQVVIKGYIDKTTLDVSDSSHSIAVAGRDKTGDLVDCAAAVKQWRNVSILDLAKELCAPFGIEVVLETEPGKPLAVFKTEPGETVFKALERAAKIAGILLIQARGALVLTHAGAQQAATPLVLGGNIKSGTADYDYSERFSEYTITGQRAGKDNDHGKAAAHVRSAVKDEAIKRHRPFAKSADGQATPEMARRQAEWEKQVREAKSTQLSCTVAGWTQHNGQLWDINQRAQVEAATLAVQGELLISAVEYGYDDSGEITKIELIRPEALLPSPEAAEKANRNTAAKPARGKGHSGGKGRSGGKRGRQGKGQNAVSGDVLVIKPDAQGNYKPGNFERGKS